MTILEFSLFLINRTIVKENLTSIGMTDIHKDDTFATNPQQS